MHKYNPQQIERDTQALWQETHAQKRQAEGEKPTFYALEMFPYPSGRLHMGHVRNYTIGDAIARYKKMRGFDVFHPIGWDAFGLPAENAAAKHKVAPASWTEKNIATMRDQLKRLGFAYDWDHEVATCRPDYYGHQQQLFLKLYEKGLAYRKASTVNWDPVENTVLANEQVVDGKGWRSGAPVEKKKLTQWFFKITDYAEDLLAGLDNLPGWPEKVKTMQRNWIGKSVGAHVTFKTTHPDVQTLDIFTTRPDTLYGASFCAIAAGHPLAQAAAAKDPQIALKVKEFENTTSTQKEVDTVVQEGIDTGFHVIHPLNGERYPIYIANYVLMEYGTGAIFGCPAHDERDHVFATRYNLPITPVVKPREGDIPDVTAAPYLEEGLMCHSPGVDGFAIPDAKKAMVEKLEAMGAGKGTTQYRLRDWGVSRQRYWGCPIPMVHCDDCGIVPAADVPVHLPMDVSFDKPGNPLDHHPTWKHTTCPKCGGKATRETDTFDTFVDSSWYFLRFPELTKDMPFSKEAVDKWLPVNQYIGGIEHAVMHLLYARFMCHALSDCGLMEVKEPFENLMTQGMVCHATFRDQAGNWRSPDEIVMEKGKAFTLEGHQPVEMGPAEKMSKSKCNVVDPDHIIDQYGADTARLFVMSDSPPEKDFDWTESGVHGAWKFIQKVHQFVTTHTANWAGDLAQDAAMDIFAPGDYSAPQNKMLRTLYQTVAAVQADYDGFHFNKLIARVREAFNALQSFSQSGEADPQILHFGMRLIVMMLYPLIPHVTCALWTELGCPVPLDQSAWPSLNEAYLVEDQVTLAVQVNGKMRGTIEVAKEASKEAIIELSLALETVQAALQGKTIRKSIVVPGRIVNHVVG